MLVMILMLVMMAAQADTLVSSKFVSTNSDCSSTCSLTFFSESFCDDEG